MSDLRWRRYRRRVLLGGAAATAFTVVFGRTRLSAVTSSERSTVGETASAVPTTEVQGTVALFDGVVHTIAATFDPAEYARMAATYQSSGTKDFIEADLTVDGTAVGGVGLRLKGNSTLGSLRRGTTTGNARGGGAGPLGVTLSFDRPAELPWLISFDEFVKGQRYQGYEQLALRPASGAGLAEALALRLVATAGEPTQKSAYASFSVNGGEPLLRLVVEVPDSKYADDNFTGDGVLYKALSTGTFRYLGDDPLAYASTFKQITNKNRQDLKPVIDLVKWATEAADAEFAAHLPEHVEVQSFARYVAIQDLLSNFDDMSGPGQNYYLWYDLDAGTFRVLSWDMNLAFGGLGRGGGAAPVGAAPAGGVVVGVGGGAPPGGAGGFAVAGRGGGNALKSKFVAAAAFAGARTSARANVKDAIYTSGASTAELERLRMLVASSGLVATATLESEAAALLARVESLATSP